MCLYPRLIKNRKYVMNKKNGGDVPVCDDIRKLIVPVGCGKCIECRKQNARAWQVRLLEDVRHNKNGKFVTLTFSNEEYSKIANEIEGLEGYELDNEIATIAMHRFRERWRKEFGKSIRHWMITELGHTGTEHLHIHGIIWTDEKNEKIEKHWKYGYVWIGDYVSEKTVNYIIKYVSKEDADHKEYKPKILTSAGIGSDYLKRTDAEANKYKGKDTKETYTTRTGHKMSLPIYYRNKIYSEDEKEKLWIEKLDKQERWVCGERISIKDGEEEYYKTLEWYRGLNKQLGYGDDEKNWERIKYENEKRILKQQERIKKDEFGNDKEKEFWKKYTGKWKEGGETS